MPFSQRIGFATVVSSTRSSRTASFVAAMRPAKPTPSGMRTPSRTSSSMPQAARATSWPEPSSSSRTAAVSASRIWRTRLRSSSNRSSTPSRASAESVTNSRRARRSSRSCSPALLIDAWYVCATCGELFALGPRLEKSQREQADHTDRTDTRGDAYQVRSLLSHAGNRTVVRGGTFRAIAKPLVRVITRDRVFALVSQRVRRRPLVAVGEKSSRSPSWDWSSASS